MASWYRMYRNWQDHPAFAKEPYTEREAFEWLIANAVWENKVINIKGKPVTLTPGQISFSIRFMAEAWQWHRNKVGRFLSKLEEWQIIGTANGTGQTVITICNYTKY